MTDELSDVPVSVAIRDLRAEGYVVGPDRFQRLSAFGIESTQKGNRWYFSPGTRRDLRFVLDVERTFQLGRDHDGLALELACRGYHTVPWDRVHASAQKRVVAVQSFLDRHMHRANNWGAPGFHRKRIPHLARQLARRAIPKRLIEEAPRMLVFQSAVERLIRALLEASYLNEPFKEREIAGFFLDLGAREAHLGAFPRQATDLFNSLRLMILMDGRNQLLANVVRDASPTEVQTTIRAMRQARPLLRDIQQAFRVIPLLDFADYPDAVFRFADKAEARIAHGVLNVYYAMMRGVVVDEGAVRAIESYASGNAPGIVQAVEAGRQFRATTDQLIAHFSKPTDTAAGVERG